MRVLVIGAAEFLGLHLVRRLSAEGQEVHAHVEPRDEASEARRAALPQQGMTLYDSMTAAELVRRVRPETIVVLGSPPERVADSGRALSTFCELLEAARDVDGAHVVFESSAEVYGVNDTLPFGVAQLLERPVSLEGALHRSQELLAQTFSFQTGLPSTALRFFSVYGPFGPPHQAVFAFARALAAGAPVALHAGGQMRRDFTFVDDAVEVLVRAIERPPEPNPEARMGAYAAHNVGTGTPTPVSRLVDLIEAKLGKRAERQETEAPKSAMPHTWADVRELQLSYGFRPRTALAEGVSKTLDWWLSEPPQPWR